LENNDQQTDNLPATFVYYRTDEPDEPSLGSVQQWITGLVSKPTPPNKIVLI
jgi:hypothetical protein